MSSRERFEAFLETGASDHGQPMAWLSPLAEEAAWQAWQARDAEIERLVEALRRIIEQPRNTMSDHKALVDIVRIAKNALREYETPKEKP